MIYSFGSVRHLIARDRRSLQIFLLIPKDLYLDSGHCCQNSLAGGAGLDECVEDCDKDC